MKSRIELIFILSWALSGIGCSNSTEDSSFTGTWAIINENGISGQKSQVLDAVTVAKNQFRIVSKDLETESIDIYDGNTWNHKTTELPPPGSTESVPPPVLNTAKKSDIEVDNMRFWKRSFSGTGIAGGQIAGRETVLYQSQENRSDGQITLQTWVDPETKVVLKRVFAIYSSQIEQLVSKSTEECQTIHYGPVDETAFTKL
jgi:hypothetical protein